MKNILNNKIFFALIVFLFMTCFFAVNCFAFNVGDIVVPYTGSKEFNSSIIVKKINDSQAYVVTLFYTGNPIISFDSASMRVNCADDCFYDMQNTTVSCDFTDHNSVVSAVNNYLDSWFSNYNGWYSRRLDELINMNGKNGTAGNFTAPSETDEILYFGNQDLYDENGSKVFLLAPPTPALTHLAEIVEQTHPQDKILAEIVGILPVVMIVIVGLIACWKGLRFLLGLLKRS